VGRPQQIEGLEAALASIRTEIESRDGAERSLAAGLDELRSRETAVRARFEEAQNAAGALRLAANDALSWTGQAEIRLAWQESRRAALQTETDDAEEQLTDLQNELAELGSRAEALRAEVDRSGRELDEAPLEENQEQAAHWQTRAAVSQRAAEDALARVEDRMQAVSDLRRRREDLIKQISSFTEQEDLLRRDSALLEKEERQVEEQIEKFKELIGPVEEDLRKLETQQDAAQEFEAGARHSLTAAERNHSQAQITLARRQEHLENLRQRIEDDFGLVSFEYDENISGPNPLPLGSFVESLPKVIAISPELGEAIKRQRAQLRRMGAINPEAKKEFDEVRDRFEFMAAQMDDLNKAEHDIMETVGELDLLMEREFRKTFDEVAREFRETFTRLFGGGSARLVLTDPGDLTETGVDIEAQLPGRRLQGLSLLSGGERSLTAVALVLSLIKVSPTPFCVLDEVDAMLDEANVNRLADLLRELSERTQFIVITHNRNTVQAAQTIYGITMGRDSTSQVLSLKLDEVIEIV
jgi:chromosome segregation protein